MTTSLAGISLIFAVIGAFTLNPNCKIIGAFIDFKSIKLTYMKRSVNADRFFGGTINNPVLVALPMFVFMRLMLDQSGVAQRMMTSMLVIISGQLAISLGDLFMGALFPGRLWGAPYITFIVVLASSSRTGCRCQQTANPCRKGSFWVTFGPWCCRLR